jgi:TolA-binding protein
VFVNSRCLSRWRFVLLAASVSVINVTPIPAQEGDTQKRVTDTAKPANRVPDTLNFANGLLRDRRYDLAAEEYERFLRETPNGEDAADARYGLATARLFLGQYADARRQFETFLAEAPSHPNVATARFRVGETAYMLGDLAAARQNLTTYTKTYAKHRHLETAWPYLGDVCFRLGDLPAARTAYETALDRYPEGRLADRARFGLAKTRAAQGESNAALKLFTDLTARDAKEWSEKARFQIGVLHAAAGRFAEAVAAFEALEAAYPRSSLLAESHLRRAEALGRLGRNDEAEQLLRPLAAADSALAPQAAYDLGVALAQRGQAEAATATWDAAIKRFPRSNMVPALHYKRAELRATKGQIVEAREEFLSVAHDFPKDPWAGNALLRAAELALRAKDSANARALATEFATRYPTHTLLPDAHLIEAQASLALGRPKDAIPVLTRLLAEEKPSPATAQSAKMSLGVAYRDGGQPEKSAEILSAIAKGPEAATSADAQFLVGQEHYEAKRYAEAVPALESYLASKANGDVADHALAILALAQNQLGETEKAWACLERLAREFPHSPVLLPTRLQLGEAALTAKQYTRAAEALRPATTPETEPAVRLRALSGLGWALLHDQKPNEAAETFKTLLDAAPNDPLAAESALARGRALEEAGKTEEALAAYSHAREKYTQSERAAAAELARARLLDRAGRPADAATGYERYVTAYGEIKMPPDGLDTVLAEWGWALLDAKKPDDADKVFNRLLEQFPESARAVDARVNLADSQYRLKNLDEVGRLLDPVVAPDAKVDPVLGQHALFRLGRTRFDRKDWSGAISLFDRATEIAQGPYQQMSLFWKAEAALQAGDPKTAEAAFSALITAPNPPVKENWFPTARLRRLQSLVLLERWDDALVDANAIKTELPKYAQMAEVDYATGRALLGKAKFDDARTAYQRVIDTRGGDELAARAQLMRGEAHFLQNNYREALKEYLRVVYQYDQPKQQATALLEAGKVYERLDQWNDAVDIYQKLIDKFPKDASAAEAAKRCDAARQRSTPKSDNPADPAS